MKKQRMTDLEAEMRKVARGEIAAPKDAALPSVESTALALIRLLTPNNRSLLRTIRDAKPQYQEREAIKPRDAGEETFREIAASYNVSAATISRLAP